MANGRFLKLEVSDYGSKMNIREFVFDNILRRYPVLYKISRRIYEKLIFEKEIKKNQVKFITRIKKMKPLIQKYIDTSQIPNLNIIIITIDCLRNSHLSYNRYFRHTTPFLDSLKGYKTTMSVSSPWTYPSMASILTGFYPHNHGAILDGDVRKFDIKKLKPLKGNIITLSEILYFLGFNSYSGTSIPLVVTSVKERINIQKLYSIFTDAKQIIRDFMGWITKSKQPFFAHIHLGDLHEPISPPKKYRNYFGKVDNLPKIDKWAFTKPEEQKGEDFEKFKENKILLYDNTLRYVDYVLEQFYSFLEEKGLIDSTILIITSDHGEEFWDHAELEAKYFYDVRGYAGVGHGHNVFNELIQVPLIMSGPNIPNKVDNKLVSNVDIVPTILDLLNVSHNILFDGVNIFKAPSKRVLLSENTIHGYEKKALIYDKYKFIYSENDNIAWIFNLEKDPAEQHPILDEELSRIFMEKLFEITKEKIMSWKV